MTYEQAKALLEEKDSQKQFEPQHIANTFNGLGQCGVDLGEYLNNVLGLEEDEKILSFVETSDYSGMVLFVYDNGKVSKVPLSAYESSRKKLVNG